MRQTALLLALLAWNAAMSQSRGGGNTTTSGPCSPVIAGNSNKVTVQCGGLSQEKADQLVDLMNSLLKRNMDLTKVYAGLDKIQATLDADRVAPEKLKAALESADMRTLHAGEKIPVTVLEAELSQRSIDGKSSVASKFFTASLHSREALAWLDTQLEGGLDPNLTVAGDYYRKQGILAEALSAGNADAVRILLRRGASPHAYQELDLTSSANVEFLFPFLALAHNAHLDGQEKRELAAAMLQAGAVIPKVSAKGRNGWEPVMYQASEIEPLTAQLGIPYSPTPEYCDQSQNSICTVASKRTGKDWCRKIASFPREIEAPLDGAHRSSYVFYDVKLDYLLLIADEKVWFLGLDVSRNEYVLVTVGEDGGDWTVYPYLRSGAGSGQCKDGSPSCWSSFSFDKVGATGTMRSRMDGDKWVITQQSCTAHKLNAGVLGEAAQLGGTGGITFEQAGGNAVDQSFLNLNYAYCFVDSGKVRYKTRIFPYYPLPEARIRIQKEYGTFVKEKYGALSPYGGRCDFSISAEQVQQAMTTGSNGVVQRGVVIKELDWVYKDADHPVRAGLNDVTAADGMVFTSCHEVVGNRFYASNIFQIAPGTDSKAAYSFVHYVGQKYGEPLQGLSYACSHGSKSRIDIVREDGRSRKNMGASRTLIETGWAQQTSVHE